MNIQRLQFADFIVSGVSDFFCFSINTSRRRKKLEFLHTLFLENEEEISEKNTEQCFLTGMKFTCQITVTFEHVENRPKTGRTFLPRALQMKLISDIIQTLFCLFLFTALGLFSVPSSEFKLRRFWLFWIYFSLLQVPQRMWCCCRDERKWKIQVKSPINHSWTLGAVEFFTDFQVFGCFTLFM